MELPLKLARATSPAEMMEVRDAFQADMLADYSEQADALHRTCVPGSTLQPIDYGGALLKAQQDASGLIEQAKVQAERIIASARAPRRAVPPPDKKKPGPRGPGQSGRRQLRSGASFQRGPAALRRTRGSLGH